ncbi:hypothetical protein DIPPA_20934 [Diplonema papillatum]|nr:hypothetical protein DIPPA_20934 [Diplonema papillatum]|eukprot:gene19944-30684_t
MFGIALTAVACALSAEWVDLFRPPFTGAPLELMLGIGCAAPDTCYLAGANANSGFGVFKATDPTFSHVDKVPVYAPEPPIFLLSVAAKNAEHAVTGGVEIGLGGPYYTRNGLWFNNSLSVGIVVTQAMQSTSFGFAYVGTGNAGQGPAVSKDGGLTFHGHWLPKDLAPEAPVRYGAFPSENVWYVTGGAWPNTTQPAASQHALTSRLLVDKVTGKLSKREIPAAAAAANTSAYTGMIAKTTDGGATWTKVFATSGDFYLNGISCATTELCIAVGEGYANDGSTDPGAHVLRTEDGGSSWQKVYQYGKTTGGSVIDVNMLSATEVWVATSYAVSTLNSGAQFLHSTDGGKTFTEASSVLSGVGEVLQMSFINGTSAYAVGVTVYQDSTILALRA